MLLLFKCFDTVIQAWRHYVSRAFTTQRVWFHDYHYFVTFMDIFFLKGNASANKLHSWGLLLKREVVWGNLEELNCCCLF
jgi:hypothetical protein